MFRLLENFLGSRRFSGKPRAAEQVHLQLTRTLELVMAPEQLQSAIMGYALELYRAGRAMLLLWNPEESHLQQVWQSGCGDLPEPIAFPREGRLVRWLQVNETALWPAAQPQIAQYLEPAERQTLDRLGMEVCIPLQAMNRLVGLILLGELAPGAPGELPRYMVHQIALALQNTALYAQQQLRLRRLSRAERLATTGELAASAAHEIRNPLTKNPAGCPPACWGEESGRAEGA